MFTSHIDMRYKDFTIKAKIEDLDKMEVLLQRLGAQRVGLDRQTDTYFEVERGKLKWRQGTIENLITHYERIQDQGMERTIVYRYDLHPSSAEIDSLLDERKVIGIIKKERIIYLLDYLKIHIDQIDHQRFLEIEAIDREEKFSDEELKALCWELKNKLGILDGDLLPTGYFNNRL